MSYQYDMLLKNGMVVDYATDTEGCLDVGIKDGKIVELGLASQTPVLP